jgi:uncharacterized protein
MDTIITAIALLFIFEGMLPFLSPDKYQRYLESIRNIKPEQLRVMGGVMMCIGLILLYSI